MRRLGLITLAALLVLGPIVVSGALRAQEAAKDQSATDQVAASQGTATTESGNGAAAPHRKLVMTENELRTYRLNLWASLLKGDMKEVYDTYGVPSARYRESTMGRVVEKWIYSDKGKEFSFEDGKLIKTADFQPGSH
jgi:hypothetical protein